MLSKSLGGVAAVVSRSLQVTKSVVVMRRFYKIWREWTNGPAGGSEIEDLRFEFAKSAWLKGCQEAKLREAE